MNTPMREAFVLYASGLAVALGAFFLKDWNETPIGPPFLHTLLLIAGLGLIAAANQADAHQKRRPPGDQRDPLLWLRYLALVVVIVAAAALMAIPYVDVLDRFRRTVLVVASSAAIVAAMIPALVQWAIRRK